jgi:hypothetical protein
MAGGSKPRRNVKRADKYQDGARKGGGMNTRRHAGPGRASKTPPTGTKGAQLQRRMQP